MTFLNFFYVRYIDSHISKYGAFIQTSMRTSTNVHRPRLKDDYNFVLDVIDTTF